MSCDHQCNHPTELPNSRKGKGRWSGVWIGTCFRCDTDVIDHPGFDLGWDWRPIFLIPEQP